MYESVSAVSIAVMLVVAAVTILLPVAAFWFLTKRAKCNQNYVLVGIGAFVVAALILETLLHQLMFRIFGEQLTGNTLIYALYGGLAAGLFEETARYISMKLFMKKNLTKQNSLVYGIGHGGAEAILLCGMTYISNVAISVLINLNQFELILKDLTEDQKQQVIAQLSPLWEYPSHQFLLAGVERAAAFALQICLSYIVYRAVKYKKPIFDFIAVAIHFAVDAGIVLLSKAVPVYLVELILLASVACLSVIVYKQYKAEKELPPPEEAEITQ